MLSMVRLRRRHSVFLVFAALLTILIFRFQGANSWDDHLHTESLGASSKTGSGFREGPILPVTAQLPSEDDRTPKGDRPKTADKPKTDGKVKAEEKPKIAQKPSTAEKPKAVETQLSDKKEGPSLPDKAEAPLATETAKDGGANQDIHAVPPPAGDDSPKVLTSPTAIHWQQQTEHFPVPTESIIKLPTGTPVAIPQIQFSFKEETADTKTIREKRQSRVKEEFMKAWNGYKKQAWMHDELLPVTGGSRDPFGGWAATLVDSLDTLWIMGLKDEFEEAAEAVDHIDFTISTKDSIPLFETTIRYVGGLLGAYDVSGQKYPNLLDKAEELATVLLGAFDTPNRMPILHYQWRPAFTSQPHRASHESNLAELGSLSLEFTRLAQLTEKPRYYDAVARITDALAEFQNRTKLPGLFPPSVDATGCNKTEPVSQESASGNKAEEYKPNGSDSPSRKAEGKDSKAAGSKAAQKDSEKSSEKEALKRDISPRNPDSGLPSDLQKAKHGIGQSLGDWDCRKGGLESSRLTGSDRFSMGGNQDSTYEYFTKEYLLLGGRVDTYREMYFNTVEAIKKWLIFRPMIPGSHKILSAGAFSTDGIKPETTGFHSYELEHLTCFIGGMIGMASKVFDIKDDLETAKQLTDACVWAYGSTPTEVMAESAELMPCNSMDNCVWNETAYYAVFDPQAAQRDRAVEEYLAKKKSERNEKAADEDKKAATDEKEEKTNEKEKTDSEKAAEALGEAANAKAQDTSEKLKEKARGDSTTSPTRVQKREPAQENEPFDPQKPLSHKEFVQQHTKKYNLPPGYVAFKDKKYILRPEAIESVWYMYRLTGDPSWQDKGWKMFDAVIKVTSTKYGHSGISDVTADTPRHQDYMESFWLAETLKYFYLLFSTPDTISLDEWVLNTEAHPFKLEEL